MKILFVIHAPKNEHTAVYHTYINRANYCIRLGWEGGVTSPDDFYFSSRAGRFIPVVYPFQVAGWILKNYESFNLIVFHSYTGWVFNLLRLFLPKLKKTKVITSFHGVEALYFREVEKEAVASGKRLSFRFRIFYLFLINQLIRISCCLSDKIFCLNRQEKDFLISARYGSGKKINIVSNDVPAEFYTPRVYADEAKTILYAGQWLPAKGTRYLVQAFEILLQKFPDMKLHLAGTLILEKDVLKDFSVAVRDKVRVFPALPHEQMLKRYEEADIFIFPSLYEAFGRVVGEAMATGLPVVSTLVGLGYDIYRNNENCLVVSARDSQAIVDAITGLLADKETREKLGTEARKSVQKFRMENVLADVFKQYSAVVGPNER